MGLYEKDFITPDLQRKSGSILCLETFMEYLRGLTQGEVQAPPSSWLKFK